MKQSLTQLAQFFLFVCLCVAPNTAQTPEVVAPSVAAAASSEQARFLADNEVTNIRLEVFTLSDTRLYDSDFKAGNLLDWQWQDQQGQRLADGAYRCVITTQDLTGRSSQRQGLLLMQNSQAIWQAPEQAEAALRNTTVARAAEGMAYFATVTNPAELAAAVLAHDGTDARLMTGSGGLSVRTGNFLKGDEQEKLRLTAEGKLEVKGAISTGEGVVFPDGTVQKTAYVASGQTLKQIAEDGKKLSPNAPAVGGSGTANVLMKWAANGVDATNSSVTDLGPGGGITVNGSVLSSFNNVSATGDTVGGYMGFWPTGTSRALLLRSASLSGNLWIGHLGNVGLGFSDPGSRFATGGNATVGASLYNTAAPTNGLLVQGNVGIGTTAPTAPLEVNGLLRSTRSNVAPQYIQLNGGDSASIRLTAQSNVAAEKPLLIQNLSGDAVPGANNSIFFQTGTTASYSTKMMIDSVGRVSIGLTSSNAVLTVTGFGSSPHGVYVQADLDSVFSFSTNGNGVSGIASSASGYGIYGSNLGGGYAGRFDGHTLANGFLDINQYTAGGTDAVCRNGARLAVCSSSLRYKTAVQPFRSGLALLNRLRPISFNWKSNGVADLGLGAEDVAAIEPLLVTHNEKGEVEGVKYDRIGVVLINAVKEQQALIQKQQAVMRRLQRKLASLEKTVKQNRRADSSR